MCLSRQLSAGGIPCPRGLRPRPGSEPGAEPPRAAGPAEPSAAPARLPPRFATKLRGWVVPAGRMRPPARKGGQAPSSSLRGGPPRRSPPPPSRPGGSAPRGALSAPAGQRRGPGHREGCSAAPSAPGPPLSPPLPGGLPSPLGQLGVLIRAGNGRGGRSRGAGGKAPETRRAGSGARANSGEDASALSLLCISSTRKANSSAEGLNQAFI